MSQFNMNSKRFLEKWFNKLEKNYRQIYKICNTQNKMAENLTVTANNYSVSVPQSSRSKKIRDKMILTNLLGKSVINHTMVAPMITDIKSVSFYIKSNQLLFVKLPCFGRIDNLKRTGYKHLCFGRIDKLRSGNIFLCFGRMDIFVQFANMIQPWPLAYKRLLNKPYVNEVFSRG